MVNWFAVLSLPNILIFAVGFLVGRFWKLIKTLFKVAQKEMKGENKV